MQDVTPQDRYYVDLAISAKIRIITILGRPPDITCTSQHTRYVGGIVIIITIVLDGTHKRTYIQQRLQRAKLNKGYITKIQITMEEN